MTKHQFIEGEEFLYLGSLHKLRVVQDACKSFEFNGMEFLIAEKFLPRAKELLQRWYIRQARELITPRVQFYAQAIGQKYSQIKITSAKTRWGSCSGRKTLSFSWRLMMTPLEMVDYVVAHEVAHLQELNHSSRFWDKVKLLMPDYKQRMQWFRNNQHLLRF